MQLSLRIFIFYNATDTLEQDDREISLSLHLSEIFDSFRFLSKAMKTRFLNLPKTVKKS